MTRIEFVEQTVLEIEVDVFEILMEKLLDGYISFQIIDKENVTRDIFAEKLCDYFEKVKMKTDLTFNKIINRYISDWEEILKDSITVEATDQKDGSISRAKKYYDHALKIKNNKEKTLEHLVDYTRIMLCLYMAVIDNDGKKIKDFDFSSACLDIDKIIEQMKKEKVSTFPFGQKNRYDMAEVNSADVAVFVMVIILFFVIKNNEVVEG